MRILKKLWRRLKDWRRSQRHHTQPTILSLPSPLPSPRPPALVIVGSTACDGPMLQRQLNSLSDEIASLLLAFLGPTRSEITSLVECCDQSVFNDHWMKHTRLRIPPDATRSEPLLRYLCSSPRTLPPPAHFSVDTNQLSQLIPLCDDVQGLTLDHSKYAEWLEREFEPAALSWFPHLARLEIHNVHLHPIDLHALGYHAPLLQCLKIKEASRIRYSTELRELWLENTSIVSLAIAEGLMKLATFTLTTKVAIEHDSEQFVAPLSRLTLRGTHPLSDPQDWASRHLPTLQSYTSDGAAVVLPTLPLSVRTAIHARELRQGRFEIIHLEWLEDLPQLEQLELTISDTATHCRPIRFLKNLQELWITDGWLCDLVGYLPKLTKLVIETNRHADDRARLGRRPPLTEASWDLPDTGGDSVSRLGELVVSGRVAIDWDDSMVHKMLQYVVQIELFKVFDATSMNALVQVAASLPHLERVLIRNCAWSSMFKDCTFLCAPSITELYAVYRRFDRDTTSPLPTWVATQAPKLRVLAVDLHTEEVHMRNMPRLTHAFGPISRLPDSRMRFLCVITLWKHRSCEPFRRERGPGRLLPSLQSILHPVADCMWSDPCYLVNHCVPGENHELTSYRYKRCPSQLPWSRETFRPVPMPLWDHPCDLV